MLYLLPKPELSRASRIYSARTNRLVLRSTWLFCLFSRSKTCLRKVEKRSCARTSTMESDTMEVRNSADDFVGLKVDSWRLFFPLNTHYTPPCSKSKRQGQRRRKLTRSFCTLFQHEISRRLFFPNHPFHSWILCPFFHQVQWAK